MGSHSNQSVASSADSLFDHPEPGDRKHFIRVGDDYQAEIPECADWSCAEQSNSETDEENLLWTPFSEANIANSQVDSYLETARTATMKTSCNNLEHALHVLHQAKGDISEATLMLTSGTASQLPAGHPMLGYQYSVCDAWSEEETEQFYKSLRLNNKQFHKVSKNVDSKSVKQCVQYFYVWKKQCSDRYRRVHPGKRGFQVQPIVGNPHITRGSTKRAATAAAQKAAKLAVEAEITRDTDATLPLHENQSQPLDSSCVQNSFETVPDCTISSNCSTSKETSRQVQSILLFPCSIEGCCMCFSSKRSLQYHLNKHKKQSKSTNTLTERKLSDNIPTPTAMIEQSRQTVFPCAQCERVFLKVKSRNAHMKCHKGA